MKKILSGFVIVLLITSLVGCMTLNHTVGNGPKKNRTETQRQWYVLFGLVPINQVDSQAMAGDASDYEITSQITFVDGVITAFTSIATVYCQSVTVTK